MVALPNCSLYSAIESSFGETQQQKWWRTGARRLDYGHVQWGDKADEMQLVPMYEYVHGVHSNSDFLSHQASP
jgi:hypothetical protein